MRWAWVRSCWVRRIDCSNCSNDENGNVARFLCPVDQHLRLILQGYDLIVDLLQGASGGQDALRVVIGIEHDQLRRRRLEADADGDRDKAGGGETTEAIYWAPQFQGYAEEN